MSWCDHLISWLLCANILQAVLIGFKICFATLVSCVHTIFSKTSWCQNVYLSNVRWIFAFLPGQQYFSPWISPIDFILKSLQNEFCRVIPSWQMSSALSSSSVLELSQIGSLAVWALLAYFVLSVGSFWNDFSFFQSW